MSDINSFVARSRSVLIDPKNTVLFLWLGTVVTIIITFLAVYLKIKSAPQVVALHYNIIVGVDVLGSRTKLYEITITGAIIAALNAVVVKFVPLKQRFYQILFSAVSFVCAVILLVAVLFLYQVN